MATPILAFSHFSLAFRIEDVGVQGSQVTRHAVNVGDVTMPYIGRDLDPGLYRSVSSALERRRIGGGARSYRILMQNALPLM